MTMDTLPQARSSHPDADWPALLLPEALYGLAGDIVRAIEPHTEADPVALLIQGLIVFGNVVGRGPHFMAERDRHGVNLFAVLVGRSSKGRKGVAWGHVKAHHEKVDPEWAKTHIQAGLASGEGLIWAVRDPCLLDQVGIPDKRLMVLEAEFASVLRVMGRDGNTLSSIIRQAWDSGDLQNLTKNSPVRATAAHISITGHITKDELLRYLDRTEAGSGFGNRFLWVCVKRSQCLPEGGRLETGQLEPLLERLKAAVEFARKDGELTRDDEAREIWLQEYPTLSQEHLGMFGAITSRAEAQVMRLACLYALLDMSYVVKAAHLRAGLALWRYCEASARYIFGSSLGDPVADSILRALRACSVGLTRTGIRDLFGRNRRSDEIDRALGLLEEHDLARPEQHQTQGRPEERWFAVIPGTTKTTETT